MTASRRVLIVVGVLIAVALGLPWGGAVPNAAAQQVLVTDAVPGTADQGTLNLDVTITGENFARRANAKFYLAGTTNPAGVTVNSTRFVNSTKLVANIDVAAGAVPGDFDIEVKNADGRTGKGTEMFTVLKKIDPCSLPAPMPTPAGLISNVPGYPGYLDSTFGSGTGRVIGPQHVEFGYNRGSAVATDSAGRIVAVGYWQNTCVTSAPYEWAVARYLPDGNLDPAFGSNGTGLVTMGFAGGAFAHSVVVQPDDKIVVVGRAKQTKSSNLLPVVVRFNGNGTPDTSFGTAGAAWVSPGGKFPSGLFYAVALDSSGKIVAAGESSGKPFISRLNANGTLDTTFNGSGRYLGTSAGLFQALTMQVVGGEERIVVAGFARDASSHPIAAVWRFTSGGVLDSSFNGSGVATTSSHGSEDGLYYEDEFETVTIGPSNGILVAGYSLWDNPSDPDPSQSRVVLARFTVDGDPDGSFGLGTGKVLAPFLQEYETGRAMAIQPDGRIVVGGYSHGHDADGPTNYLAVIWRFTADGVPDDPTFGPWGMVSDPITSGTRLVSMGGLALHEGRIVVAGYIVMESDPLRTFGVLARFWQ